MLKVENLVTEYGAVRAIDGVSFTAAEGKITTVIGANGAGKSTLLRTISGLERAKSGQITWADKSLIGKAPEFIVRSGIAHVPEGHAVISQLSVAENIELGGLFRKRQARGDLEIATKEVYELFPILYERRREPAGSLSGGERQMLAISRALVARPKLLLLDEPTNHLDLESITAFNNAIVELNGTVLMSSYDHTFVQSSCNRIVEFTPKGTIDRRMPYDDYLMNPEIKALREKMYGGKV